MCRSKIPTNFEPEVLKALQKNIRQLFKKEFSDRKALLSEKKQLTGDAESIIITYGNKHEKCQASGQKENIHKWTMLVKLNKKKDNKTLPANIFFEKVRFGLHESFGSEFIDVRADQKGEFEMSFKGWGTFDIPITIFWRREVGLEKE